MTLWSKSCSHERFARAVVAALVVLISATVSAPASWAEPRIMSAADAHELVGEGSLVLLDIRSEEEWRETGLPKGAWPVSLHTSEFGDQLGAILNVVPPEQVALICATGGRTAFVAEILKKNGIQGVIDVSEGMSGNPSGPGWMASGLPVVSLEDARAVYLAQKAANFRNSAN